MTIRRTRSPLILILIVILVAAVPAAMGQTTEKRTVEGLIYDLKHPESDRRIVAARALGRAGARQAVPALIELTADGDETVRLEAVKALVNINDPRALPAYIRLTRDGDRQIQKLAIDGVVKMYVVPESGFITDFKKVARVVNPWDEGFNPMVVENYIPVSEEAVRAIGDLLFHQDSGVREEAAEALGILRAGSAVPTLGDALAQETNSGVKVELIRAIYKIGDPAGGELVRPFIRDPNKLVHDEAIWAVGVLKTTSAVPQLNEMYSAGVEERKKILGIVPVTGTDDLQKKVLRSLARIGDESSRGIFEDALQSESSFYRRYGAEGLGRIADDTYLSLLARRYLREESNSVKLALGFSLFRLGREEHLEELVLESGRDQALGYLLELTPTEVESLYPHVRHERESIKIRLLEVLGRRGGASAIPVAEEMAASDRTEVAAAATLAMRRLRGRHPGS